MFFSSATFRIVHGSLDSVDLDVLYLSPCETHRLPSGAELTKHQRENPDEDANFALFDCATRQVVACCRGLPSEVNNALLQNERKEEGHVAENLLRPVVRCVAEKVLDTLQRFAIVIRRAALYRDDAVNALRTNNAISFLRLMQRVDWDGAFGVEESKQVAFMVAQTIALMDGKEVWKFYMVIMFSTWDSFLLGHCPKNLMHFIFICELIFFFFFFFFFFFRFIRRRRLRVLFQRRKQHCIEKPTQKSTQFSRCSKPSLMDSKCINIRI